MHTAGCISSTLVGKWVAEPREAWELTHTECTQAANRRKKLTLWLQDREIKLEMTGELPLHGWLTFTVQEGTVADCWDQAIVVLPS